MNCQYLLKGWIYNCMFVIPLLYYPTYPLEYPIVSLLLNSSVKSYLSDTHFEKLHLFTPKTFTMIRNWYAVYTKPNKEKRVSSILGKKGITNFCPVVAVQFNKVPHRKQLFQPLFNSFVFVQITEAEMPLLKSISWVANFFYWKSKPAIISNGEIDIIRNLTSNYSNIRLEKTIVDMSASVVVSDEPSIVYSEKSVSVKYNGIRVKLPSLGYTMIAERVKQKEATVYQEPSGLLASFPRRINAFFFN